MRATELYNLLEQNKEKLTLIDQIQSYHPGMGTELGWSYYTGGMKDDGDWILEKLIKAPYHLLQSTLDKWAQEEQQAKKERDEEEKMRKQYEKDGKLDEYYRLRYNEQVQKLKEFRDKQETSMIWGDIPKRD